MGGLVSIVIPNYNLGAYLGDAIGSALAQTYPRIEVIVVDDGSTDGSLDVLRSFGDRIRWETGPNRGGGAARNRGMALARGERIQFLDSDDLLMPEKVSEHLAWEKRMGIERECLGFAGMDRIDAATGAHVREADIPFDETDSVVGLLRRNIQTPAVLHWTDALRSVGGFDVSLPCGQEFDLHLRLALAGVRFRRIDARLYRVRMRAGGISADERKVLRVRASILRRTYEMALRSGTLTGARRRAFAEALVRDGRRMIQLGLRDEGVANFQCAEQLAPAGGRGALPALYRAACGLLGPVRAEHLAERVRGLRRALFTVAAPDVHAASRAGR